MTAVAPPVPAPQPENSGGGVISGPDPLAVETIVAAIGIRPFVDRTMTRVHGYHADRAAKLADTIGAKIYRFLTREEPEEAAELPPFDFDNVTGMLKLEQTPDNVTREVAAFGADVETAVAANLVIQRIRGYLVAHIPRLIRPSLAGPISEPPPPSDVARFRRLWVVACDPLSVLDDLNEFALSRDQVTAFADLYPAVYGTVWPIAQQQLARRKTVEPKYRLTHRKEILLRVLTRQENTNAQLGQALQALYAQQEAAAAAGQPVRTHSQEKDMANEATASASVGS